MTHLPLLKQQKGRQLAPNAQGWLDGGRVAMPYDPVMHTARTQRRHFLEMGSRMCLKVYKWC